MSFWLYQFFYANRFSNGAFLSFVVHLFSSFHCGVESVEQLGKCGKTPVKNPQIIHENKIREYHTWLPDPLDAMWRM